MVVFPELDPFAYAYESVPARPHRAPTSTTPPPSTCGPTARTTTRTRPGPVVFTGDVTLRVGDHTFNCLRTPGHTPGQLAVHVPEEGVVFTGDTIFSGCQTWLMTSERRAVARGAGADPDARCRADRSGTRPRREPKYVPRHAALGAARVEVGRADGDREGLDPRRDDRARGFKDEFGPVDVGQGYMLDHIQSHNAAALCDKLTGTTPQLTAPGGAPPRPDAPAITPHAARRGSRRSRPATRARPASVNPCAASIPARPRPGQAAPRPGPSAVLLSW